MIKTFFQTRGAGFYVGAAGALLALIVSFVYLGGYVGSVYMSWWVFLLPLFSAILFAALSLFRITAPWAAVAVAALNFTAFLLFASATYLYLSQAFYAGVSWEAFQNIDPAFLVSALGLLIAFVLGNVSIYLNPSRTQKEEKEEEDA